MDSEFVSREIIVEKLKDVPNPRIPQWRVRFARERGTLVSAVVLRSNPRSYTVYAYRWNADGEWKLIKQIGRTSSRDAAFAYASRFLEYDRLAG